MERPGPRQRELSLYGVVEGQSREESQRLGEVLSEVRTLASKISETQSTQDIKISVDILPKLASPISRTFWRPSEEFDPVDMVDVGADPDELANAMMQFGQLSRINWREMRELIEDGLAKNDRKISLAQLLERQSGQNDIVEVLGFIQIALDDGHGVDGTKREDVFLERDRGLIRLRIPVVVFTVKELEGIAHE